MELKQFSDMLDQHLAKRYPDLAPSAELLQKQKIHSNLLNELQAQQQKNRNLTEELDLLKQEEDEVRTAGMLDRSLRGICSFGTSFSPIRNALAKT